MLDRIFSLLSRETTFVVPALTLSFYSDKTPILLSNAKRIQVTKWEKGEDFINLFAGDKVLSIGVNSHDDTIYTLQNGNNSAILVMVDPKGDILHQFIEGISNKDWLYNAYSHKVFTAFLKAAEPLTVDHTKGYNHVLYCPIEERVYHGIPYANRESDCLSCMFCIDASEDNVLYCTGKHRLAQKEDFEKTLEERKKEYDEFLMPNKTQLVKSHICPACGSLLEEKTGKHGKFLSCESYPICDFTAQEEDNGFISFNY